MRILGIDSGSVSMKGVIIDENKTIIKSFYTKNIGLLETIRQLFENMKIEEKIDAVGITGSGRDFISVYIGGDIIESEIISHYIATMYLFPDVRTIMDIGGEDSKIMLVENKNLIGFAMNHDCGGGTGSMIENIALRMGISLENIGEIALSSKTKVSIPSKCGIFAQSAVVSKLNKGVPKEDILMGVCRGLVGNYFAMLTKGVRISPPYIFQGATAKNKALIKCFEEELKDTIFVPENPELMGAYGVALLTLEQCPPASKFKGFENINKQFETRTYYGTGCSNECEITMIYENNQCIAKIGNRCQKCI